MGGESTPPFYSHPWFVSIQKLPKTLKELGESAFGYCGSLKEITFPDAITKIPDSVCRDSGIEKVTFGKKVTSIESSAYLINEGSISVKDNGKNSKEPPVLITGKLKGKGKITGKNYIKQK